MCVKSWITLSEIQTGQWEASGGVQAILENLNTTVLPFFLSIW